MPAIAAWPAALRRPASPATLIDRIVADITDAASRFILIFASTPFPSHKFRFDWLRADNGGGNWYYSEEFGMEGWLCPALFKYFSEAPKHFTRRPRSGLIAEFLLRLSKSVVRRNFALQNRYCREWST